ncbi:MAG TPA: non-canonical purine NTP pyrophosphatase [Candidatus Dojkabacteria bacterium]
MNRIHFATTNDYKIKFANNLLKKHSWECIPSKVTLIEPQSMTQAEISQYKVLQAYEQIHAPIITMDSGLFINSLKGLPGIYTADFFKALTSEQILRLLDEESDRSAYIQQTLSFADGKEIKSFSSKSEGIIVKPEETVDGYAFDAFFKPTVTGKLMAQMSEDEKSLVWGEAWNELGIFLNQ